MDTFKKYAYTSVVLVALYAYLNWILFDEQFRYVPGGSGFIRVPGYSDEMQTLAQQGLPIAKSGYLFVYLSNETEKRDVFFDNLTVNHYTGPLVEETSYYPFGLKMAGISSRAVGRLTNREKTFQGQRFDDELGLNWIQFKWRNHDPQIGRFVEIDPLSEEYVYNSTYAFSENKVTAHVELEGLEAQPFNAHLYPTTNGESTQIKPKVREADIGKVKKKEDTPAFTLTVSKGKQFGVKVAGIGAEANFGSKEVMKVTDTDPGKNQADKESVKKGYSAGVGVVGMSKDVSTKTVKEKGVLGVPVNKEVSEATSNFTIGIKNTPLSAGVERKWTVEQFLPRGVQTVTSDTGLQPIGTAAKMPGAAGSTASGTGFSLSIYYKIDININFKQLLINILDDFNTGH